MIAFRRVFKTRKFLRNNHKFSRGNFLQTIPSISEAAITVFDHPSQSHRQRLTPVHRIGSNCYVFYFYGTKAEGTG